MHREIGAVAFQELCKKQNIQSHWIFSTCREIELRRLRSAHTRPVVVLTGARAGLDACP